jgi:UDPglucose 6-dehydrogenase
MTILVVGCGFVGNAVATSLEDDGQDVVRIDPKLYDNKLEDHLLTARGAVVCVPTPTIDGECDDSIVKSVIAELGSLPTLLKSTVPPHKIADLPNTVTYNPEFLRAKTAEEDFKNQKHFILGGTQMNCFFWYQIFGYLDVEFIETDRTTASMVKYMHNAWLATKVAFFHEVFYNVGKNYNHDSMIDILAKFENIGPSHMGAPNDEGLLGYGGHCFPKDTQAFYDFTNSDIMKQVIEVNNRLREASDNTRND